MNEPEIIERLAEYTSSFYTLHLFIAGMTPNSHKAVENVKKICEEYLTGRYELEIIDIYQQPHLAEIEQIFAVPTLIKKLPFPSRRLIGNMSDKTKVLMSLDLREE